MAGNSQVAKKTQFVNGFIQSPRCAVDTGFRYSLIRAEAVDMSLVKIDKLAPFMSGKNDSRFKVLGTATLQFNFKKTEGLKTFHDFIVVDNTYDELPVDILLGKDYCDNNKMKLVHKTDGSGKVEIRFHGEVATNSTHVTYL